MRGAGLLGCALLVVAACGADDGSAPESEPDGTEPSGRAMQNVFDLSVGDCFDGLTIGRDERAEVTDVLAAACDEPHDLEVFHAFEVVDGGRFPGTPAIVEIADQGCAEAFVRRLGEEASLGQIALWPTFDSWRLGDRRVLCAAFQKDGNELVGSLP